MSDDQNETVKYNPQPAEPLVDRPGIDAVETHWKLLVRIGDQKVYLDLQEHMLIGRSIESDPPGRFALDLSAFAGYQSGVSRHHATITHHEGGLYLEDMGSTNGTRINGFQLAAGRRYRLRDGDEVEFARLRTLFRFVYPQ